MSSLKRYHDLIKRIDGDSRTIERLKREAERTTLNADYVVDMVTTGKRGKKPIKTITIRGYGDFSTRNSIYQRIYQRIADKAKAAAEADEIREKAKDELSLLDDREQTVALLRCFQRRLMTWETVGSYTGLQPKAAQKIFQRSLHKIDLMTK